MRIGVTGAHGFLGNEVVWQVVSQGHTVRAIVRDPPAAAPLLPPGCEVFGAVDLCNSAAARSAAAGLEAGIHPASVFCKCDDMENELVLPNSALVEEMVRACKAANVRLVFT